MGMFNVPQFIDIEDKIVGPLTAKQLGWLGVGGVILLITWATLDFSAFIFSVIIIGIIFGALAFYKPHGQPLIIFISSVFTYFFKPKIYIWRRVTDVQKSSLKPNDKKNATIGIVSKKEISGKNVKDIADLLDSNSKF